MDMRQPLPTDTEAVGEHAQKSRRAASPSPLHQKGARESRTDRCWGCSLLAGTVEELGCTGRPKSADIFSMACACAAEVPAGALAEERSRGTRVCVQFGVLRRGGIPNPPDNSLKGPRGSRQRASGFMVSACAKKRQTGRICLGIPRGQTPLMFSRPLHGTLFDSDQAVGMGPDAVAVRVEVLEDVAGATGPGVEWGAWLEETTFFAWRCLARKLVQRRLLPGLAHVMLLPGPDPSPTLYSIPPSP